MADNGEDVERPLPYTCGCDGCWACSGHEDGCTCDVDWDVVYGHSGRGQS